MNFLTGNFDSVALLQDPLIYSSSTTTSTFTSGLSSMTGFPIMSDSNVPPGEVYLIRNNLPFKFVTSDTVTVQSDGNIFPLYGQLSRKAGIRSRDLPVIEPEITQFERSISFDD